MIAMKKTVIELFAGVGGFRVGLNNIDKFDKNGKAIENGPWNFVWANQWEPATKTQDAFDCYALRFGKEESSNEDISTVDKKAIPDHTLLTGGFPCQDYSVARSLHNEKGISGKKGVLWWQINDILKAKKPSFVLLENVDRLLKAPARQRGQAFGIILRCFCDAGYGVQWRVINAADYGHPQRRRRTFIFAFHKSTEYFKSFKSIKDAHEDIIISKMMFSKGFSCSIKNDSKLSTSDISKKEYESLAEVSSKYQYAFGNAGYCLSDKIYSLDVISSYGKKAKTLGECLDEGNVPAYCYKVDTEKFKYLKGSKHIERTAKNGHKYMYSEGPIPFPDKLDMPGRTMLTSEGTTNRSSHFIKDPRSKRYRILTPIECERLDEFPDDWTKTTMSPKRRYFIAGNALVTGLIKTMGEEISKIVDNER
jgi:DNA (cytosine-5)-methyltransferase 1